MAQAIQGTAWLLRAHGVAVGRGLRGHPRGRVAQRCAASVIATTRLASPGNPPIEFSLAYNAAKINFMGTVKVNARIDCNRGRGTWKSSGANQLQFGPLALTRAKCADGSMHDQMVKRWETSDR